MMRRCAVPILSLVFAGFAFAQTRPAMPGRASAEPPPIQGEARLRWICDRLDLTPEQKQQMEALLEVYRARMEEFQADAAKIMERVRDLYAELVRAKAEGNKERQAQLEQAIKDAAPSTKAENEFFDSLSQSLTEAQKAKLPQLRLQAGTVREEPAKPVTPTTTAPAQPELRPIQVLSAARQLNLTTDQLRRLEQILEDFRTTMRTNQPRDPAASSQVVQNLAQSIRTILTPEQAIEYDRKMRALGGAAPTSDVEVRRLSPAEVQQILEGKVASTKPAPKPATQPADTGAKKP